LRKLIKEELPLAESYPYAYNPNRSKNYYNNIELDEDLEIDFDKIKNNIEDMLAKFTRKENKTVVIFDNISTMPNGYDSLVKGISLIYQFLTEKVIINFDLANQLSC
jgi:hypothetical protein